LAAGLKAAGDEPGRIESFTVLAPIEKVRAVTTELAARTLALIDPANSATATACRLTRCSK